MAYKNCYYPYLEKKVYGNQKLKRKTTQTDQAPPTIQKQIKQNTKQERKKNWTKTQASTRNSNHKSKSFDSVGRTVERRFGRARVHIIPH